MGILDTLKGLLKGREKQVAGGIDKVSDTLERKVPAHASKIDAASDKAKDALGDLGKDDPATGKVASTTPSTPTTTPSSPPSPSATPTPSVTTPPVSTPPVTTPPVTEDDVTPPPTAPLP